MNPAPLDQSGFSRTAVDWVFGSPARGPGPPPDAVTRIYRRSSAVAVFLLS
jgi:hypothetical protein